MKRWLPSYLINDVFFGRSPKYLGNHIVQRLCVPSTVRPVEQLVPPVFDPVRIQPQEKHKAVEICVHIRLKYCLLLQYIHVFSCKVVNFNSRTTRVCKCVSELALPSKPLWTGVPLTHQRLTDARRRAISAACHNSQKFKIK